MEGLVQQQPASPDSPAGGLAAAHSTATSASEAGGTGPSTFDGGGSGGDGSSATPRPSIESPGIKDDDHDDEDEVTSGGSGKTVVSEAVTSRILPADVLTRQDSRTTHSTPEGKLIPKRK